MHHESYDSILPLQFDEIFHSNIYPPKNFNVLTDPIFVCLCHLNARVGFTHRRYSLGRVSRQETMSHAGPGRSQSGQKLPDKGQAFG